MQRQSAVICRLPEFSWFGKIIILDIFMLIIKKYEKENYRSR